MKNSNIKLQIMKNATDFVDVDGRKHVLEHGTKKFEFQLFS